MSLQRYTWRAMQQRPGRTVLTILSIVIGVTAAVAVGLGTATTRNAYKQMFAMVTGRASLEVEGKGGKAFAEDILAAVEGVPGIAAVSPLLSRPSSMTIGDDRRLRIQLLGIDLERDQYVRDYDIVAGRQVQDADEIVLEKQFADYLDLKVGDEVRIPTPAALASKTFKVVGLFTPRTAASFTQLSMAFMEIGRAQRYFNTRTMPKGAINKIQIVTGENVDPDKLQPMIAAKLRTLTLNVARGDESLEFPVILREPPVIAGSGGNEGDEPLLESSLGIRTVDSSEGGVKVAEVVKDGPAEKAGLRAEDVITAVGGRKLANRDALINAIERRLLVHVHRPAGSTQLMREMLLASEQGLRLTTYFSLLMAAIIIVNTFFMNVTERRRHISIMRAVGATRKQIALSLIGESLLLGVVGTLLGLVLGVVTAFVVTYVLATSFQVQLPRLVEVMTPQPFIIGAVFGLGMAFVGAAIPAIFAGFISPLEGMNRSAGVKRRDLTWLFLMLGTVLTLGSASVIYGSIAGVLPIGTATFAAVTLLIGLVILDGVILPPQATIISWLLRPFAKVETVLALKQVLRHHTRSALTIAVLFIVGSTGVGMANSILDNVRDVYDWYDQAIIGDYFIRAMMPDLATGKAADLPEELGDELQKLEEARRVTSVEGASFVEAKVPAADPKGEAITAIVVARSFEAEDSAAFDLMSGDRARLREQIRDGQVVIGSVLAQKLGLKLGDRLPLETAAGLQRVPICGVANEYLVGGLSIHMVHDLAIRWLDVTGVDGYVIKAPDESLDELRPELEAIAKKYDVILLSRVDVKRNIDGIVRGAAWSLWALVYIGFIVAAFGVVNTLTMNVLEQTRELGLLRIVAMTKKQVRRTILTQAMIIGGVGLPPGIALGVVIAYVINLAMMPSFGHPVDFHIHPRMLIFTFLGAVAIVLIAAIIPARRATQVDVVEALHYE